MRLKPHQFNGFLFQLADNITSHFPEDNPYDWNIAGIASKNIARSQNFPVFATKDYAGAIKLINVTFTDVNLYKDSFIISMDVLGENQHQLICLDEFGRAWYVNAVCVGLNLESTSDNTASFGAIFEVDDPIWKKYTPSTVTIAVNGTGSGTITPIGNQPALPIISITPTASGAFGFAYRRFVQIINRSSNALWDYPLDIGAGLNTAALVTAGKMLASGDDLRVFVDGVEVQRWLDGMNTATTKIWINWTQPANSNMTLGAAIAGAGSISTVTIQNTTQNNARMALIPSSGNILIGSEVFVYTGKNVGLRQLTGVTRAERQTSAGAHSIGDTVYFLTHDVWIYYGYPTISAYVADDTKKPIIKLTSTNTSWIYEEFGTVLNFRSIGWVFNRDFGGGYSYTVTENGGDVDPYQVMGMTFNPGALANKFRWIVYQPCGVTTITASGKKIYHGLWVTAAAQKAIDGINFTTVWTEATPSSSGVWEALAAHSAVALGGTYNYIQFLLQSDVSASFGFVAYEISDVTLALDSTLVPSITMAAELSIYNLHAVMTNAATGYSMTIDLVMSLNTVLTINTKEKTITLFDGTNQISALQNMPVRFEWFPLLPGQANNISIVDAGQGSYVFSYEDRSL